MLRLISLLITIPVTLFVIFFAVSNTQDVTVYFNIFDWSLSAPFYAISLGLMAAGFIIGALLVWLNLYSYRIRYWQAQRQISRYEKRIDDIRSTHLDQSKSLNAPATPSHALEDQL